MLADRSIADNGNKECIGYATFVEMLSSPKFVRWFTRLQNDFEKSATEPHVHEERLIMIQNVLIDLINFLDPEGIRWPKELRQKLLMNSTVKREPRNGY